MNITIHTVIIPIILSIICIIMFFRPYKEKRMYDFFGAISRLFWLIPIGFIWAVYFGLVLWLK